MKNSKTRKVANRVAFHFAMLPEESLLARLGERLKHARWEATKLWTMAAIAGVRVDVPPALAESD